MKEKNAFSDALKSTASLALSVSLFFFAAMVIHRGWVYFITPLGVPAVSYWHMVGLFTLFKALKYKTKPLGETKKLQPRIKEHVGVAAIYAACWLILEIAHSQMQ